MKKSTIIATPWRMFASSTLTAALVITTVASMALPAQGAIVMTPTTYANYGDFSVSSSDLLQTSMGPVAGVDYIVSASQDAAGGNDPHSFDGAASQNFGDMTWWWTTAGRTFPAVLTFNLDVSVNTLGYALTEIRSYAGYQAGAQQGDQKDMLVEYSLVGNAGWTTLGTWSHEAPALDQFGLMSLTDDTATYMLYGVDALRFTYAANAAVNMVLQEIDVFGVAVPEPSSTALLGLGLSSLLLRRRRS